MRLFLTFLLLTTIANIGFCQQSFLLQKVVDDSLKTEEITPDAYTQNFTKGLSFYEQKQFVRSAQYFQKAYAARRTEEVAQYLYYALLRSGNDLEAGVFLTKNKDLTFAITPVKNGVENIYIDAGPRVSGNNNAGDIYYADNGVIFRLAPGIRLWRSLNYLQQNDNLGHFRQLEYSSALIANIGKYWTIRPSVHYIYLPYTAITTQQDSVNFDDNTNDHHKNVSYTTHAVKNTVYSLPGHTHFFSGSFCISKRLGALTIEAEPCYQYITDKNSGTYTTTTTGTTDSSINNVYGGSKPYSATENGVFDSSYSYSIGQLGLSANYILPIDNEPIFLRGSAYFMVNSAGNTAFAFSTYALFKATKNFWLHGSFSNKGNQPWVSNWDGVYYNYTNPIKTRAGLSLQLFPLKHFSPWITYQYEQSTRSQDNASLTYHSIYLTFNYHL